MTRCSQILTRHVPIPAALGFLAACVTTPSPQNDSAAAGAEMTVASPAIAHGPPSAADSAAIMSAIANWERGWEIYDAELAARDYSDDADWTNAFGARRIGRDGIRALLTEVFSIPAVTAGSTEYEYHALSFPVPDMALLRSRSIREGQLVAGRPEVRRISHLRVFANRDGRWQIISHLISDERTPGQPR